MPLQYDDDRPLEDREYPEPDELDDDDDARMVDCASCGAGIYEDTVQCPVCGEYVSAIRGSPWQGRSGLWIALGLLGIIAVIYVFLGI